MKVKVRRGAGWRAGQGPNSTFCGQTERPNSSRPGRGLGCVEEVAVGTGIDVDTEDIDEELFSRSFVVAKDIVLL